MKDDYKYLNDTFVHLKLMFTFLIFLFFTLILFYLFTIGNIILSLMFMSLFYLLIFQTR